MYVGFDFETQGFDAKTDAPTEVGFVGFNDNCEELWDANFLIKSPLTRPQPKEIIEITGITDEMIENEGIEERVVVLKIAFALRDAKVLFAYNAPFDKSFLKALLERHRLILDENILIVDVQRDIDYPARFTCKKLTHLAFDHGIVGDAKDAHRAVYDVRLMLKLLQKYDLQKVIANAAEPKVTLRMHTKGPWEDKGVSNEFAKSMGFRFTPENKFWCKVVRESQVDEIMKTTKYLVERLK